MQQGLMYLTGHGQIVRGIHERNETCANGCVIHNPSDHPMRDFPTLWRDDRRIMERICEHGVGHPDPDTLAFIAKSRGVGIAEIESVHGCDGCCEGAYTRLQAMREA